MAYAFPDKDSGDKLDFTVDWTRYLRFNGVSVSSFQWKIKKSDGTELDFNLGDVFENDAVSTSTSSSVGLINAGQAQNGNRLTIVLDKGINREDYTLVCQITTTALASTSTSLVTDREIKLRVRDR